MIEISVKKIILIIVILIFSLGTIIPLIYIKIKGFDPNGMHNDCSILSRLTPFMISIWMIHILTYIFFEGSIREVCFFNILQNEVSIFVGSFIIILAYVIIVISIKELGINYRIQLPKEKTELITSGIFRFMRNPFYFGLYLLLLGTFFLIPSIFSLIVFFINFITFNSKAKDEEQFLLNTFGEKYEIYKSKVRRNLPFKIKIG